MPLEIEEFKKLKDAFEDAAIVACKDVGLEYTGFNGKELALPEDESVEQREVFVAWKSCSRLTDSCTVIQQQLDQGNVKNANSFANHLIENSGSLIEYWDKIYQKPENPKDAEIVETGKALLDYIVENHTP